MHLVETSELSVKHALVELEVPRSTFYIELRTVPIMGSGPFSQVTTERKLYISSHFETTEGAQPA